METLHFCSSHALLIQHNENEAFKLWQSCMRRAVTAFVQCRVEDAKNYFSAAIEIALLRFSQVCNEHFSAMQLIKPLEFLCKIDLAEDQVKQAAAMVEFISKVIEIKSIPCTERDEETLTRIRKSIIEYAPDDIGWSDQVTISTQQEGISRSALQASIH